MSANPGDAFNYLLPRLLQSSQQWHHSYDGLEEVYYFNIMMNLLLLKVHLHFFFRSLSHLFPQC
jgi:hypothetical protein